MLVATRGHPSCDEFGVPAPPTFVASLAPDGEDLARVAEGDACADWREHFEQRFAGQQIIVRVDRIELSKNILRGFWAFEELLERWPSWQGRSGRSEIVPLSQAMTLAGVLAAERKGNPVERARVNGVELEYTVAGSGEPVVLLHGGLLADENVAVAKEAALTEFLAASGTADERNFAFE